MAVLGMLPMGRAEAQQGKSMPASPPSAVAPGPGADAVEVYLQGRRADALALARPLAEQGNADALYLLGFSLETPEAAKASRAAALDYYYRLAAKAGHREALPRQWLIALAGPDPTESARMRKVIEEAARANAPAAGRVLGEAWLRGLMTGKPDFDQAVQAWRSAADAGDAGANLLLARLYDGEFGFPDRSDAAKCIEEYRKAATANEARAFVPLASRLLNREPAVRDEKEGRVWLDKALAKHDGSAWFLSGDREEKMKGDLPRALEAYRTGAGYGDAACMLRLARYESERPEGDVKAGREWLDRAVKTGSPAAAAELGIRLLKSDPGDVSPACRLLLAAANNGESNAQYELAMLYLSGKLGTADPFSAVVWLTEAMKAGNAAAQYQLGILNEIGLGTPLNYANAGVLYTMACGKGHAGAAIRIARMALEGLGTKKNLPQAWAHATLAVERGEPSATALREEISRQLDATQQAEAAATLVKLKEQIANPRPSLAPVGSGRMVKKPD